MQKTKKPKKFKVYSSDEDSDDMKVCSGSCLVELFDCVVDQLLVGISSS